MKRIYDAAFAPNTSRSHHKHLGTFWWVDVDTNGNDTSTDGTWTRGEAHDYVAAHRETVYVKEGGDSAYVYAYHSKNDPSVKWIQTEPDGKLPDNLITLARRHG
jgi:hypothetical protein